ncbi:MAG: aldose epimerase family protein [Pseudomonadota bacterium]
MTLKDWTITGHGLTARFTNWGASLVDLRLEGHRPPLVLGLQSLADYKAGHASYMGATAGRFANRIGQGRFALDGVAHRTDPNFLGRHTLHGGSVGMGKRIWDLLDQERDALRFGITLADGEMGFPGTMRVEALFTCAPDATLRIDYRATTDAVTLCNLAHHSYWTLDGQDTIADHILTIPADRYTPVDDDLIPTGVAPVDGTPFDFRQGRPLPGQGLLDHNLCLADGQQPLRDIGTLHSTVSGLTMTIASTEPGCQVYDGAKLNTPVPGLDGRRYGAHAGVALEPQTWPDAPNHPDFPDATLRPGDTYKQITSFRFTRG